MALALIVLAIGSIAAGYIGMPHALGGHNQLATWLEPAFEAPVAPAEVTAIEGAGAGAPAEAAEADDIPLERTLMMVSTLIAFTGIGLAAFFWLRRPALPAMLAQRFRGIHALLLNKYYVDEIYDGTLVQPVKAASQEGLWRGVDVGLIDGAVNGAASLVAASSAMLRRLQTGSVRTYAGSVIFGAVVILGYYLWR